MNRAAFVTIWAFLSVCGNALAQTSSLGARHRHQLQEKPRLALAREDPKPPINSTYEQFSWITDRPAKPRRFRPGDLITIIVRERRQWKADADLKMRNDYELATTVDSFLKLADGGIGQAAFRRGKPSVEYEWEQQLRNKGNSRRKDMLTTRLSGRIIDVKPNGLLVVEAWARTAHDEEVSSITLTGVCRREDVTADNTVLSTQIADKEVVINNEGALRSSASRGWMIKLIDLLRPF